MIARIFARVLAAISLVYTMPVFAEAGAVPDFREVQQLVREHFADVTDETLNRAAVDGLIAALKGRAMLVTNSGTGGTNGAAPVARQSVFDGSIGYVRIAHVAPGLAAAVEAAAKEVSRSNKLAGLVLDLRFAQGDDYAAAANTVDLFLQTELPLLNAGKGLVSSHEKTDAIRLPVVALVNGETSGAAEALGAMLRQTGVGLLVGRKTAGQAGVTRDFKLANGQTLRLVTGPVQLGNAKAIPSTGVLPDIDVPVSGDEEAQFYADPFAKDVEVAASDRSTSGTNGAGAPGPNKRVRVTEADLVRERRGDGDVEKMATARAKAEAEAPKVKDPALGRAIDLLKGLAVARQWKF